MKKFLFALSAILCQTVITYGGGPAPVNPNKKVAEKEKQNTINKEVKGKEEEVKKEIGIKKKNIEVEKGKGKKIKEVTKQTKTQDSETPTPTEENNSQQEKSGRSKCGNCCKTRN